MSQETIADITEWIQNRLGITNQVLNLCRRLTGLVTIPI